jgi:hypothetical protein
VQLKSFWDFLQFPMWRSALRVIRFGMLPVALGFLAYLAWNLRATLNEVLRQADVVYLIASVFLWIGAHLVSPSFSALSLSRKHQAIHYGTAFRIHARNIIARYIPGGVWHTVGRVADFSDRGLSSRRIAGFVFLENSLALSVTLTVGGAGVWYFYGDGWGSIGAVSLLAGLIGLALSRLAVNRWILPDSEKISPARYASSVAAVAFFWVFAAASFLFYLHAFPGWILPISWLQISSAYLLAWGMGFLAVFAPQGMGVFEMVLAGLISDTLPLGAVAVLVGGFRVVMLCADMAVWLMSRAISTHPRRDDNTCRR